VSDADIYTRQVLCQIPRLLAWQDREPLSQTYGCFDRTYWSWKFTDFPGARYQEGVYALASLYTLEGEWNRYFNSPRLFEWIRAGFAFWRTLQYSDGSFDEAYPHEHSLAATAFTGFYVGEAYLLIRDKLPETEREGLEQTLRQAGLWLCENDETHGVLSNHLSVAAAALNAIYRITGIEKFSARSQYFLDRIHAHQSEEGWLEEYGGADPGYQTHATFYLAHIYRVTQDSDLLECLRRSLNFLKFAFHPNRTLGGEYGSRNTEFYFPAGIEMLADQLSDAASIASFMRPSIVSQSHAGIGTMDAQNLLPMLNNYLFAAQFIKPLPESIPPMPCQEPSVEVEFPDAGLVIHSTKAYYAVLGVSKGAVLRVYRHADGRLIHSDCGYWAKLGNGTAVSHQALTRPANWRRDGHVVTVLAPFVEVNQRLLTPWLNLAFRLTTLVTGRVPVIANWIKRVIVNVLINRKKKTPLILNRKVTFGDDTIFISDEITVESPVAVTELCACSKFSTIHMGSSRYFQDQELDLVEPLESCPSIGVPTPGRPIIVRRNVRVS